MKFLFLFFTVGVLGFAETIGPEESFPTIPQPTNVPIKKVDDGKTRKGTNFTKSKLSEVHKKAFLIAFKRQSESLLTQCLEPWAKSPSSMLFQAELTHLGKLTHVQTIDSNLPECAAPFLESMNFSHVVEFKKQSTRVMWRVDW